MEVKNGMTNKGKPEPFSTEEMTWEEIVAAGDENDRQYSGVIEGD